MKRVRTEALFVCVLFLAACGSSASTEAPSNAAISDDAATSQVAASTSSDEVVTSDVAEGVAGEQIARFETQCFRLANDFELPEGQIAVDVSPNETTCWFITQQPGLADTTVIAGELFISSEGRTFEEFVAGIESGLAVGQEPDLLPLQLMNTGATGRALPVIDMVEFDSPNRAAVFLHESDRRDGFDAISGVVEANVDTDGTAAMIIWGIADDTNIMLFQDIINAMAFDRSFTPQ